MAKRAGEEQESETRPVKRVRLAHLDRLSRLSDELLLRIFSNLSIITLNLCQRVSPKLCSIASDSQLWKSAYYNRFVRPRASRLPGIRDAETSSEQLFYSSKLSKWLDEENLVARGKRTNWKRQYKLRHNWSIGRCDASEIEVAEEPPIPPLLVRLHDGIVYTADSAGGLRAWSSKNDRKLLASASFKDESPPTALAVDVTVDDEAGHRAVVGFENGGFMIYTLNKEAGTFKIAYSHAASSNGMLSAVAFCSSYLVTMTAAQLLSLYKFPPKSVATPDILDPPWILHSLKSNTVWPPLSLAIRSSSQNIIVTIAYAIPTYISGWTVGIQELWLSPEGTLLESRLATSSNSSRSLGVPMTTSPLPSFSAASPGYSKPTSLSYTHPYLLLSHPDNTLTLYLVNSTDKGLHISSGRRLWGHTSSVSGAHVGGRGKAVSVTTRGDELRIWELEGASIKRRLGGENSSVRIRPERRLLQPTDSDAGLNVQHGPITRRGGAFGLLPDSQDSIDDAGVMRGWVGFDEENIIVLKEGRAGCQALVVYDFT